MMEAEMSKAWSIAEWMKRGVLLLAASSIVLTGCQGVLLTYKGAKVRDAYLIALTDGTQKSASYQSPDLTIKYQWVRSGNELQLSGLAKFTPRIENNFSRIPSFLLSVFFTDAQGSILEDRGIPTPGSDDSNNQLRFSEKLLLPPGTANMAFSYSGQACGGGGADGSEDMYVFLANPYCQMIAAIVAETDTAAGILKDSMIDDLVKSRQTDLFENLQSTNSGTYKLKNGEF